MFTPANVDACALFRLFLPHLHTPGSQFYFDRGNMNPDRLAKFEVAVVQRLATMENLKALQVMKQMGMKVVYDLDDDLWNLPSSNPGQHIFRIYRQGFSACASLCDVVTVSTQHLKVVAKRELMKLRKYRAKIPEIVVVENGIDLDIFHPVRPELRKDKGDRIVVGWAGSNTHEKDVSEVFGVMVELLREIPELEFEVVGPPLSESFGKVERVKNRPWVPVAEFAARMASWQWDLSLAPLYDNSFTKSKSAIKALEAGAMQIPCLMSSVAPYQSFLRGNELLSRELLCHSKAEWRNKLVGLIKDRAKRETLGTALHQWVLERGDVKKRAREWHMVFNGC